jgi:6-phosphogluconolactonase (cycloisomerase 2 family)
MKIGMRTRLLLAAAPLLVVSLTGCSGFWDAPSSSTTTTTSTSMSSGYFYIMDSSTSQVIAYSIDSGSLTLIAAYDVPNSPLAITVAPNNKFLYVSTNSGIYVYTISSGALTEGNSKGTVTSDPATSMQVDSTDSWLVEGSGQYLYAIPIDSTAGDPNTALTVGKATLTGSSIDQLVIAPNNDYVFVAEGKNGTEALTFNANNSNPLETVPYKKISPVSASNSSGGSGAAVSVAVDPSERLVYIGETDATTGTNTGGLRAFTISSGTLSEISGSPYSSGGSGPYAILAESAGDYVYVANWQGTSTGNITGFTITDSSSTYSLTTISTTASTGTKPMGLAEDNKDNFVLSVSEGGTPYFDAYIFDTTTSGVLDSSVTSSSYVGNAIAAQH